MNIYDTIERHFVDFSPKEKKIAAYVLQESQQLRNINIQHLSELAGTSPATVTRFCRKVGCESFVDLKIRLQRTPEQQSQTGQQIFQIVSNYYNRVLQRTAEWLSESQIRRLIHRMVTAKRIVIYGVGSSGLTAQEMAIRLTRMGLIATAQTDTHMMIITSTVTHPNDLVIGISNSGETKEVIHALKNAKQNQTFTIAMSSIKGSTLSQISDESFMVYNSRFVNHEQFANTQLPMYYLLDIVTLMLLENEGYQHNMQKTIHEITQNLHQ